MRYPCSYFAYFVVLALFTGLLNGSLSAQTATPIRNIPEDILANTLLENDVYWFNPGTYEAKDVAVWNPVLQQWSGAFENHLGLRGETTLTLGAVLAGHSSAGLCLSESDMTQSGGVLNLSTENAWSYALFLEHGNYTLNDGSIRAKMANNFGTGIWLDRGAFRQNGGMAIFTGENGGKGLWATQEYRLSGGVLQAVGKQGNGVYVENDFLHAGGTLLASGVGTRSYYGSGVSIAGDYHFSAGELQAAGTTHNGIGLWLTRKSFAMSGGTMTAQGEKAGNGILLDRGDWTMSGGQLNATAKGFDAATNTCAAGIKITQGHFTQSGGTVNASGEKGGDGIVLNHGNYTLEAGTLQALGSQMEFVAGDGYRIVVDGNSATVLQTGTDYYGCGIVLDQGDFIQKGGNVTAVGVEGGCGIVLTAGNFIMEKGALALLPGTIFGDGKGLAAMTVGGQADFRQTAQVIVGIDFANHEIGNMMAAGGARIEEGAELDIAMFNSVALGKNTSWSATFLTVEDPYPDFGDLPLDGTILGHFTVDEPESLTLAYRIEKNDGDRQYDLIVNRKALASEFMQGNNADVVRAMENVLPSHIQDRNYRSLLNAYTVFDAAQTAGDMNAAARSFTPWQATRFAGIGINLLDAAQRGLSRNLALLRSGSTECGPCSDIFEEDCSLKNDPRHLWFAVHGNFGRYGAKSDAFESLDVDSYGMNLGLARYLTGFGNHTVLGIACNYTYGEINGSRSESDYDYFGFLASLRTGLSGKDAWTEVSFGYSYAEFKQGRYDYSGMRHDSTVDNDLIRLGIDLGKELWHCDHRRFTPIAGLEYTFVNQEGYAERSINRDFDLTVRGDESHSLRLRMGAETEWTRKNLRLTAYGFFRYEMLDARLNLDSRFSNAPLVRFRTQGQKYERSDGVTGLRLDWQWNDRTALGTAYDFTVGDEYTDHWVDVSLRRVW